MGTQGEEGSALCLLLPLLKGRGGLEGVGHGWVGDLVCLPSREVDTVNLEPRD